MFCPKCGRENADQNVFCAYCGLRFSTVLVTKKKEKKKKKNPVLGVIAAVVALAVVATSVLWTTGVFEGSSKGGRGRGNRAEPVEEESVAAKEANIRYALGLLIDRNYIVENITMYGELPANTFVAEGTSDFAGSFAENANGGDGYFSVAPEDHQANVEEALGILQQYYQYENGKFTNFPALTYLYNENDTHRRIGEYIRDTLAVYGIEVVLQSQDWSNYMSSRENGSADMFRHGWVSDHTDPIAFLELFVSNSSYNSAQLGKGAHADVAEYTLDLTAYNYDIKVENGTWAETYDLLIATIKNCDDPETRYELMHIAEDMLMNTGCIMPLYYYTDVYMVNDQVKGVYVNPYGMKYFDHAYMESGSAFTVGMLHEPDSLDPVYDSSMEALTIMANLYSGLARWTENGVVADCAESLVEGVKNPDGTVTYTYTLREDLCWSDGKLLTAHDFEFSWKRAAALETGADYGYLYEVIVGYGTNDEEDLAVEALDNYTLQVTLVEDIPYWNELLAFPIFFPVAGHLLHQGNWGERCNGPFKLVGWDSHYQCVVSIAANPYYHGERPSIGYMSFFFVSDASYLMEQYESETWLMIEDVPTTMIPQLQSRDDFYTAGALGTYFACFNVNTPLLPE